MSDYPDWQKRAREAFQQAKDKADRQRAEEIAALNARHAKLLKAALAQAGIEADPVSGTCSRDGYIFRIEQNDYGDWLVSVSHVDLRGSQDVYWIRRYEIVEIARTEAEVLKGEYQERLAANMGEALMLVDGLREELRKAESGDDPHKVPLTLEDRFIELFRQMVQEYSG